MRITALLVLSLMLSGCVQTISNIDARVAELSDKLAARCVELKAAALAVDLLAPERVRLAVQQGQLVFDEFCARPPRTGTDALLFVAKVIQAKQAIDAVKRGA